MRRFFRLLCNGFPKRAIFAASGRAAGAAPATPVLSAQRDTPELLLLPAADALRSPAIPSVSHAAPAIIPPLVSAVPGSVESPTPALAGAAAPLPVWRIAVRTASVSAAPVRQR